MSVSTASILNKLQKEAKQANNHIANPSNMQKHVANVKLLCELLLDEEESMNKADDHSITSEEMKAMIGTENRSKGSLTEGSKAVLEHEDANGESLFDF